VRTPLNINVMDKEFPECTKQLYDIFVLLEKHYSDMQVPFVPIYVSVLSVDVSMLCCAASLLRGANYVLVSSFDKISTDLHNTV
jgi:hypothetical protein